MKRVLAILLVLTMSISILAGCSPKATKPSFPEKSMTMVIPFAAGGYTDLMGRSIAPLAEKYLNQSIVVKNSAGGNGAIGGTEILSQPADGYTIGLLPESYSSHQVMGVSDIKYADFEPIVLLAAVVPVIVVNNESKFTSVDQLIKEAKEKPGEIKVGNTGPTGVSGVVASMLGVKFNRVPFKGEGEFIAALLGGQVDVTIQSLASVSEYVKAGKLRILAVVSDKKIASRPELPALGEVMPEYNKYLPWNPFTGVWVKKGTPEDVVNKLKDSFVKAANEQQFKDIVTKQDLLFLNLTGEEAWKYVNAFTSKTAWLLYDTGAAKKSPADFGIAKP